MPNKPETCEKCGKAMDYVEDVPFDAAADAARIHVPFASAIYDCPEHGRVRVY